ncbi:hypothetical protein GCM10009792_23110 [Microcella alkalica]|uniref:Uncharacterized protein n=1 Tax=Microcella alkalica TaxID=355930 RepID=A0A839E5T4_9MICO|nr:hypothetical protein [Microcella alkalica]MBA8846887.1 hypothetical protein [Microcella alkalica]
MTHHGNEAEHENAQHPSPDEPVGGTLGSTGTEGYGMPEQVVGDELHTDERSQTAEESVPADQVLSDGGVSADPLDGSNATGGYGDESTGLSDQAGSADGTVTADDRDPGEDANDLDGGNADR